MYMAPDVPIGVQLYPARLISAVSTAFMSTFLLTFTSFSNQYSSAPVLIWYTPSTCSGSVLLSPSQAVALDAVRLMVCDISPEVSSGISNVPSAYMYPAHFIV